MIVNSSDNRTVGDANDAYISFFRSWAKCRAICGGEELTKDFDRLRGLDVLGFSNLLIPFSPSMDIKQYNFYLSEAELPGITANFAKMLVGGLLRKKPQLTLPNSVPAEAIDWITEEFGQDDCSLAAFLDQALWEELQTSRAWVFVDHPRTEEGAEMDAAPYPYIVKAENVINWKVSTRATGSQILEKVLVRGFKDDYKLNEFHPRQIEVVWVHELNENGKYQIRTFEMQSPSNTPTVAGEKVPDKAARATFVEVDEPVVIMVNDEPIDFIPAWPLNGHITPINPMFMTIVDKEIALYNKVSRRNHLLYGAATYTPVVMSDMSATDFQKIVDGGLGTWIKLDREDRVDVLRPPTEALSDMDRTIAQSIEEIAKLGVRMLAPESGVQSGVALEIRNAAQTAQLGSLNVKCSDTMKQVIAFMIKWRYDIDISSADIEFSMTTDFNPSPLGADWLRLATEWYQQGLIPRSVWLELLKQNDMIPPEYSDKDGLLEIANDAAIMGMIQRTANPEPSLEEE